MSHIDPSVRAEPDTSLEGRSESRVSLPVLIYLSDSNGPQTTELVVSENVSRRGVRVFTKRRCEPGEHRQIAPAVNRLRLTAEIVYCTMISFNRYWVGLKIHQDRPEWWKAS